MCLDCNQLRVKSYTHALGKVLALVGVESIWDVDLRTLPRIRAMAWARRLELLVCLVNAAQAMAGKAGLRQAARQLATKQRELGELTREAERREPPTADVIVLDDDWGKKGRGARILAWIRETGATAPEVAAKFQLALSTAKTYVRRARSIANALKIAA